MTTRTGSVDPRRVADQVTAMLAELDSRWPGGHAHLRTDTVDQLASWREVVVRQVPESEADVECSVAGAYFADETPPIVAVANALSAGRRAFTALHELGHHLQQTTTALAQELVRHADGGHDLEEAACNAFAADVLVPAEAVRRHIDDTGPTAHAIVALWQDPDIAASRAAVCARAAERLRAPGHVLLLDPTGTVTFGASRSLPPVRRDSDQSGIAVVRDAITDRARAHAGQTAVAYRDGIHGQTLEAQAADMGGHIVLVAVADHAPWHSGQFRLPTADSGPTASWWTCSNCGHDFTSFDQRCRTCGAPHCPDCGQCDCRTVAERLCTGCFTVHPLRMFAGTSDRCIDCA